MTMANNQLSADPISIVETFNNCINNKDIDGLAALMSKEHTFIDRDGSQMAIVYLYWALHTGLKKSHMILLSGLLK
jgi:hypothetical protein